MPSSGRAARRRRASTYPRRRRLGSRPQGTQGTQERHDHSAVEPVAISLDASQVSQVQAASTSTQPAWARTKYTLAAYNRSGKASLLR
jgi:hypothetical protein